MHCVRNLCFLTLRCFCTYILVLRQNSEYAPIYHWQIPFCKGVMKAFSHSKMKLVLLKYQGGYQFYLDCKASIKSSFRVGLLRALSHSQRGISAFLSHSGFRYNLLLGSYTKFFGQIYVWSVSFQYNTNYS
jgi:hypothetical protein